MTSDSTVYGIRADNQDANPTYHIPDERGSNEPFNPISRCGEVLNRELLEEAPKGSDVCKTCSGESSAKSAKSEKADD